MMKLISRVDSIRFSTLRFPERYQKAFHLNHQIRSCLTLQNISEYFKSKEGEIRTYATTSYLEYLNEYPLTFHIQMNKLKEIYLQVLTFQNLNLYEEQLRHSNLIKLVQYSSYRGIKLIPLIKEQEQKMLQMVKKQPFDLVDAINWLVMRKNLKGNKLLEHSLDIVKSSSIDKYANIFSKMINVIITKINDMEWTVMREHKVLFQFMCNIYKESGDSISKQISNCYKLCSLQLHLLGYDQVPTALRDIYDIVIERLEDLDIRSLQMVLGLQKLLPYNYYHPTKSALIYKKVLQKMDRENIHFHILPLQRMTPELLDAFAQKHLSKWFEINKSAFFFNKYQISLILNRPVFIQRLYQSFCDPLNPKETLQISTFSSYLCSAVKLLNYYKYDSKKAKNIKRILSEVYLIYERAFGFNKILQISSLCNLFHLNILNFEQLLNPQSKNKIKTVIKNQIQSFFEKKRAREWKNKISISQIMELVFNFSNVADENTKNLLIYTISAELKNTESFSYACGAHTLFFFEGSHNNSSFLTVINEIYSKFHPHHLSLADYYLMFPQKTLKLTTTVIQKLWTKTKSFLPAGKIIAHCDVFHLMKEGSLLETTAIFMRQNSASITEKCLQDLSKGEIRSLLRFFRCYIKQIPSVAERFLSLLTSMMKQNPDVLLKSQSPVFLEEICLQTLQLIKVVKKNETFNQQLDSFWGKFPKVEGKKLTQLHYKLLSARDQVCLEEKESLEREICSKTYQSFMKEDLLQLLALSMRGLITIGVEGETFLKEEIVKSIEMFQLNPVTIKDSMQDSFFSIYEKIPSEKTALLRDILGWVLKNIRIQLGNEFYIWCLNVGDWYSDEKLILESLNWLTIQIISLEQIIHLIKTLKKYPTAINQTFVQHLAYCLRLHLPHPCEAYRLFEEYLKILYGSVPEEYSAMVEEMQKAQSIDC